MVIVGVEPILTHRVDPNLTQGWMLLGQSENELGAVVNNNYRLTGDLQVFDGIRAFIWARTADEISANSSNSNASSKQVFDSPDGVH